MSPCRTSPTNTAAIDSSNSAKTFPTLAKSPQQTGATSKIIPGLSPEDQTKAINKKNKKLRQKLKKQEELEKIEKEGRKLQNLTAFDFLMRNRHLQDRVIDRRDDRIPAHCSPQPWKSDFVRELSEKNRRMSFGSSPNLKRGCDELSSPSSPQSISDCKKNKNKDSVVAPKPQESST